MTDLELAERAARVAGALLLERFGGRARGVASKSTSTDMVSDADREAESALVDVLLAERPDDGLLGEEGTSRDGSSGRRWVIDPLDGTTNFLWSYPAWCVSVSLEDADGPLAGVVHDAVRNETFRAARGEGGDLNGEPLRVRGEEPLENALVATGFGYEASVRGEQAAVLTRVLPRVRDIRRGGSAALDLAWVAAGRVDGYFERGMSPLDTAAGKLLVLEAGGALAELDGEPRGLAAANPELLPALVGLVRN